MRDRVERKAVKPTAARTRKTSGSGEGLDPLLALQRSAGNDAVVAMLGGGDPERSPASTPGLQVGAVDDRAEADADRLADAALRRTPLDTGAFTSAPEPGIAAPRTADEPIRRLWSVKSIAVANFRRTTLGVSTEVEDEDAAHTLIAYELGEYADALVKKDWQAATYGLMRMVDYAKQYLRTNPVPKDFADGRRANWSRAEGMAEFLKACADEKEDLDALKRADHEEGAGGGAAAAWTASGTASTGFVAPTAPAMSSAEQAAKMKEVTAKNLEIHTKWTGVLARARADRSSPPYGVPASALIDADLRPFAPKPAPVCTAPETWEDWTATCARYEAAANAAYQAEQEFKKNLAELVAD